MGKQALEGVRVLDIATVIAAPWAAGLMADFGAEVIKIEMPGRGDSFRRPRRGGHPLHGSRQKDETPGLHSVHHPRDAFRGLPDRGSPSDNRQKINRKMSGQQIPA